MPQMFQYCGQRFRVFKRAHKTCDPIYSMAGRKLENAVHLELRCDGKAHGGCQVGCLLFWKDAWLRSLKEYDPAAMPARAQRVAKSGSYVLHRAGRIQGNLARGRGKRRDLYALCLPDHAASRIHEATAVVEPGAVRGGLNRSGNTTLPKMARGLFYSIFVRYPTRLAPARYIYNSLQAR